MHMEGQKARSGYWAPSWQTMHGTEGAHPAQPCKGVLALQPLSHLIRRGNMALSDSVALWRNRAKREELPVAGTAATACRSMLPHSRQKAPKLTRRVATVREEHPGHASARCGSRVSSRENKAELQERRRPLLRSERLNRSHLNTRALHQHVRNTMGALPPPHRPFVPPPLASALCSPSSLRLSRARLSAPNAMLACLLASLFALQQDWQAPGQVPVLREVNYSHGHHPAAGCCAAGAGWHRAP